MDYKEKYEALVGGINGWLDKYVGDWRRGVFNLPFDKTGEIAKDIIKLVPELRESEDEEKRKRVIEHLKLFLKGAEDQNDAGCDRTRDIEALKWGIAFLEKQKSVPALDRGDEIILKAICEELKDAPGWVERIKGWYSLAKDAQQPAECSEEDKYKIDVICKLIERATIIPRSGDDDTGIPPTRLNDKYKGELKAFVKSRRPVKQEWSEEDIDKMVNARSGKSGTTKSEMEFYRQGIKDTLKSIRPQHQWKPTEEQMEALKSAVKLYKDTHFEVHHKKIVSLYEQLKKL